LHQQTKPDLLHDFGGEGPVIHLAHANGFPPGTYNPLAATLTGDYHVVGLPARPLWPDSHPESAPDWHPLAGDLIQGLYESGLKNIIGVGHSLGGVCTMLAAIRQPGLFRAVVLIDPVILPPAWLWVLQVMRRLGLRQWQPLVQGALRRRRTWPSRQACHERYRGKPLFANWPDASLRAYVEAGTRLRRDGQVELAYPPEWEAHIFATTPTDVWRYVPQLRTPMLVVRGEHSDTFRPQSQRRMARLLPHARFHVVPGAGHLVPLERPVETGAAVRDFLAVQMS
jgi:pimeloyl-ACP methyl ester carboxylesterase